MEKYILKRFGKEEYLGCATDFFDIVDTEDKARVFKSKTMAKLFLEKTGQNFERDWTLVSVGSVGS